ncbi:phosphatase [Neptunitalea chrysea]|uniref:Phosphatase n=1 Tax=Neptunitalea chrysea TaxID=1647581 RepID=A0A9W6B2Q7_9FLAO|nr:phosphonatase-like hydrolase [Neptunitalea chrysea]GLB51303.1 phosphatase [Neptunitalea chrysea]
MQGVQMVVFDMAGTTVNEDNIVYKTLANSITKYGYTVALETVLIHGAGKEKLQAIKDILVFLGEETTKASEIFKDFKETLETSYKTMDVFAFDSAKEIFEKLRGKNIKVVLNTGYDVKTATLLLDRLNWAIGNDIDLLVTASDVERSRPHGDMIFLAMEKLAIENAEAVIKIGDSAIDIEEGKNANCGATVGITTGAQTKEQLAIANPNYIINDLKELLEII